MAKVHGNTVKAADKDLAEGTITQQSHAAVIAGAMSLQEARNIGTDVGPTDSPKGRSGPGTATGIPGRASAEERTDAPPLPVSRISKDDRLSACLCSCGKLVKGRFAAGHDMRMFRIAREHLTEGRDLSDEQREYLEESGKLKRVRARLAEEEAKAEAKRQEKDVRKGKK